MSLVHKGRVTQLRSHSKRGWRRQSREASTHTELPRGRWNGGNFHPNTQNLRLSLRMSSGELGHSEQQNHRLSFPKLVLIPGRIGKLQGPRGAGYPSLWP